ncbi:MAG: PorP/SprF family type IX secretion system membrane protein [Saprospiraceae bacterium]|nr:PorP/SprF family type IX secretion system membrane protein [Saprospiraceae bacterium]
MHVKKLLLSFFALLTLGALSAQDVHFTQYYMAPTSLNPAMLGKFEGTARIGGIYRDQWRSILNNNRYGTPSAFIDAPIFRGFRKRDWIGAGLTFVSDQVGSGSLRTTVGKLGGSYHFSLDKKGNSYISIGGDYGRTNRRVNNDFNFEDELSMGFPSSADDQRLGQNNKSEWSDISAGVVLTSRLNKRMDFNIGFSMFHLGKPNYGILNQTEKIPQRSVVHGQFNIAMTDRWTVSPAFLYQTMGGADEINLQGLASYLINPQKEIRVNIGAGYRFRDAINAIAGVQYKDLTVGLAYDINTSDLTSVTNGRGGFELAANYIIKIYKPAKIKPRVLCPRF